MASRCAVVARLRGVASIGVRPSVVAWVAAVFMGAVVAGACGGGSSTPDSTVPADPAFYVTADPVADTSPGAVVRAVDAGSLFGAKLYRVLYVSRRVDDTAVVVSAMVAVPGNGRVKPADRAIVSWAHPTAGSADICAPSRTAGIETVPGLRELLDAGDVVVATDYQGLGTPGPHPYLVGEASGRNVLDAARAARTVAGSSNRVALWGHSQGGQAVLFAGELASTYAADLDVVGVVAAAPAAQLSALAATASPDLWVPAAAGLASAYPELSLADVLTPEALGALDVLETGCLLSFSSAFGDIAGGVRRGDPLSRPDWNARVVDNDAGQRPMDAPLLVLQGDRDMTVPPALTVDYVARACANGTAVMLSRYPTVNHLSVTGGAPRADALAWIADRMAKRPARNGCGAR
jgi:hypothetical protein